MGRSAHLLHPQDADGWTRAMARVVEDDDWWRSLRQGVEETARPYTWDRCAADTLRVYRSHACLVKLSDFGSEGFQAGETNFSSRRAGPA